MKRLAIALMSGMFLLAALDCRADPSCTPVSVRSVVEVTAGELTLANLLDAEACRQLYQAAERVSLGAAPSAGSARVLAGPQIRRLIVEMEAREPGLPKNKDMQIPDRIVVQRAGRTKSCAEIARFLAANEQAPGNSDTWEQDLQCAAARSIPEESSLELVNAGWNPRLQRSEFALRCVRAQDCVPFLVWAVAKNPSAAVAQASVPIAPHRRAASGDVALRLVKPGQTASLTWDHAGIRIVVPVTCLDGGGMGEFVRVRFKKSPGTLRAEVMGVGKLRSNL